MNERVEWLACSREPGLFVHDYCRIYNATDRAWIPFGLWPAQRETVDAIAASDLTIILKARQLGLTWLVLCYALWLMLFRPAAAVLLFSRRDEEAVDLLDFRLKGIYRRLPAWMQARGVVVDGKHDWQLSNGSRAQAFPTTGGRSYTGTLAVVDEADFMPDLGDLLNAVKPTVDSGGKLIMLSSADKSQPQSEFKRVYLGAKAGATAWRALFLPWSARPDRDAAWYAGVLADIQARTGSLDDLHQEYPATDTEALSPRTMDKRIPGAWLQACYDEQPPLADLPPDAPSLPNLTVYRLPEMYHSYVIGGDPAEGNPTSDESASVVLDLATGEEVAGLAGQYEPAVFASYVAALAHWYNGAAVMMERNNHGHAVLLWLRDNSQTATLRGHDDKEGWLSSSKGKALLYAAAADAFRNRETTLHSLTAFVQLSSIEGATLRAPNNEHDDRADAYALALVARSYAAPAIMAAQPLRASSFASPTGRSRWKV